MEATFQVVPSFYGVNVIPKTITWTRMLKGGGFGLTVGLPPVANYSEVYPYRCPDNIVDVGSVTL